MLRRVRGVGRRSVCVCGSQVGVDQLRERRLRPAVGLVRRRHPRLYGEGTTSFENDGDTFDGWLGDRSTEGSEPTDDWVAGTTEAAPPTLGEVAEASLARQPGFSSGVRPFGRYPSPRQEASSMTRTGSSSRWRPGRARSTPSTLRRSVSGDSVVVHELAHQWLGLTGGRRLAAHLAERGLRYLREGCGAARKARHCTRDLRLRIFDPRGRPFWDLTIGDLPGQHSTSRVRPGSDDAASATTHIGDDDSSG